METTELAHQRKVEVCFSPALFPVYYSSNNCVVVVIDIFRATSAICTAFQAGIERIIPVSTVDEAKQYQEKGYLAAAERHGEVVDGFELGNSPFHYMNKDLKGKELVLTTTNGTKAIERAKAADHIVIGSFINLDAVCQHLIGLNKNVILLCAGWKDRFNLEDSLFAGAVVEQLAQTETYTGLADSSLAALNVYETAKQDLNDFLKSSSHRNRLAKLNLNKDIEYCLQTNIMDLVPLFKGNSLSL
jgi:2-phosphosulfolactate phosphatase